MLTFTVAASNATCLLGSNRHIVFCSHNYGATANKASASWPYAGFAASDWLLPHQCWPRIMACCFAASVIRIGIVSSLHLLGS